MFPSFRTFTLTVALAAAWSTAGRPTPEATQAPQPRPAESRFTLACRLANYQGCEDAAWTHLPSIGVTHLFLSAPADDQVAAVQARLASHGLKALVLRGDADLSRADGPDRLAAQLATCQRLGVKYLFLSVKRQAVDKEIIYARLRQGGDVAARHAVTIVLETHPDLGTNGDVLLETMQRVHHPNVRVNFDTGNITFYNRGTDALTELRKIIPYVATVEIKDHNGEFESWHFPALGQGRVDIPAVLRLLREHHYAGPITIEIEGIKGIARSPQEVQREIAQSVTYLRSLAPFE